MIILPYFTVAPFIAILGILGYEKALKKGETPNPKQATLKRYKRIISRVLYVITVLGCIFIIFVVDANSESNQRKAWQYNFAI